MPTRCNAPVPKRYSPHILFIAIDSSHKNQILECIEKVKARAIRRRQDSPFGRYAKHRQLTLFHAYSVFISPLF